MRRGVVIRTVLAGALLALPAGVDAQRARGPGGSFGISFVAADPAGDLGVLVDRGFGMELHGAAPMAAAGHLRLRGDVGVVIYGLERLRYCSGLTCRVGSDLTTTNSIIYGGLGPELVLATGAMEPYVYASAGLAGFVTTSSLDDHDGTGPYFETTNYSDVVYSWKAGGGLRLRVGGRRKPVFLDLGVERHDNAVVSFLTEGDIVDNPDGSVTVYPNYGQADLVTFRVGISVGFPNRY